MAPKKGCCRSGLHGGYARAMSTHVLCCRPMCTENHCLRALSAENCCLLLHAVLAPDIYVDDIVHGTSPPQNNSAFSSVLSTVQQSTLCGVVTSWIMLFSVSAASSARR